MNSSKRTITPTRFFRRAVFVVVSLLLVAAIDARKLGSPAAMAGKDGARDLFVVCDPTACAPCDSETEVAVSLVGECCPVCHGTSDLDCTKCPGGYNILEDGSSCSVCTCTEEGEEVCSPSTDVSADCSVPKCISLDPRGASNNIEPVNMSCANCTSSLGYFDGCNTCACGVNDTSRGACTKMWCFELQEPSCLNDTDRIGEAEGYNGVDDEDDANDGIVSCNSCHNKPYFDGCNFCACDEESGELISCLTDNTCETEEEKGGPFCIDCETCAAMGSTIGVFFDGFSHCMCETDGETFRTECMEPVVEEFSEPYCW